MARYISLSDLYRQWFKRLSTVERDYARRYPQFAREQFNIHLQNQQKSLFEQLDQEKKQ